MKCTQKILSLFVLITVVCLLQRPYRVLADDGHSHDSTSHHKLHFSHPLIAESPSPDTKMRFDYEILDFEQEGETTTENRIRFEAEYAIHPSFSIETDIPFVILDPANASNQSDLGNIEIALKFANFAFEKHNLLLGYGIEFGLPTGDDDKGIGSDHIFEIETFLNAGYKLQNLEIVAFTAFGIPTNQREEEEVETELGHNFSLLYHLKPWLQGLLEVDGQTVLSGEEAGTSVLNITPGVKIRPFSISGLRVGLAASLPVSNNKGFDTRGLLSVFYHF